MLQWSDYFQVSEYLEATRIFLLSPELRPLILKACHIDAGAKILDVGCGTGFFTRFLADGPENLRLSGIDSQENFVCYAQQEAQKQHLDIAFHIGDALCLPFPDASFDVVVSHTFLTSVSDPDTAIREMRRVCKPDGFICSVTAMSFHPQVSATGKYPPDCLWCEDFRRLEQKVWSAYNQLSPINAYTCGLSTADIPSFFVEKGLQDVSAYPLGKLFSLSNAAYTAESKANYIELMTRASLQKLQNFEALPGFGYYVSEKDCTAYRRLLQEQKQYLLDHLTDNTFWEWDGGANCLIVGKNSSSMCDIDSPITPDLIDLKFKDSAPRETVQRIQGILDAAGITTTEAWIDSHVPGCYSVRIQIQGTTIGQNGKGMTRDMALASGYAELMERLQTGYYYVGRQDPMTEVGHGFTYIPEEIYLTADEILAKNEKWLDSLHGAVLANSSEFISKRDFLDMLAKRDYAITEKPFIALPFYQIKSGEKVHIPVSVLQSYYATNGTCAGNSKHEAIVQGLSEIVERHHNLLIHNKCITPPTIPDSFLEQFQNSYALITAIRQQSRYNVIVKDCSLGEGYPVVATVLMDLEKHSYIVKFGSHPVFEIALERSMTEIFQGRSLETAAIVNALMYNAGDVQKADVIHNVLKNATGQYHYRFFSDQADYTFVPPLDRSGNSNHELFGYALSYFQGKGLDVYIRNASYLGFSTFQILVPSFSEIYNSGTLRLKELKTHQRVIHTVNHLDQSSQDEIHRLVTFLKYKEYFALENTLSFLTSLPLQSESNFKGYQILYFIACLKDGNLSKGIEIAELVSRLTAIPDERSFFSCFAMLLRLVQAQGTIENALTPLQCFYSPETTGPVIEAFTNPDRLIEKYGIHCDFCCESCKNAWRCDYRKLDDAILRLKGAFKKAHPLKQGADLNENTTVFSGREQDVARLYVQGLTRKEIAQKLIISENTVKKHLDAIYKKAGMDQRKDVFAFIKATVSL